VREQDRVLGLHCEGFASMIASAKSEVFASSRSGIMSYLGCMPYSALVGGRAGIEACLALEQLPR
jgi:hypothetical protein